MTIYSINTYVICNHWSSFQVVKNYLCVSSMHKLWIIMLVIRYISIDIPVVHTAYIHCIAVRCGKTFILVERSVKKRHIAKCSIVSNENSTERHFVRKLHKWVGLLVSASWWLVSWHFWPLHSWILSTTFLYRIPFSSLYPHFATRWFVKHFFIQVS